MTKFLLLFLVIVLISGCDSNNITGNIVKEISLEGPFNVTYIVDGDTLDLEGYGRIRFSGINTPETGECYYQEAKDKLAELILGKEVFVEKDRSDEGKYGRKLRYVYLDDLMINKYLVENGFAKVYDKYKDDTKRYDELKAVENKEIGLWVCKDPKEGCLYVGSKNSDKYHLPDCTYAKKIKLENLVCYHSEEEVKDLEKCKTCLG